MENIENVGTKAKDLNSLSFIIDKKKIYSIFSNRKVTGKF